MRKMPIATPPMVGLCCAMVQVVLADNCSSPSDCLQTAGYNAMMAVAGGLLGWMASVFGTQLAGLIGRLVHASTAGDKTSLTPPKSEPNVKHGSSDSESTEGIAKRFVESKRPAGASKLKGNTETKESKDKIKLENKSDTTYKGTTYDSNRPQRKWRRIEKASTEVSAGGSYTWTKSSDKDHEFRKWGNDTDRIKIGDYGYEISSGYHYNKDKGTHSFDIAHTSGHVTGANWEGQESYGKVGLKGSVKAGYADAEFSVGSEWGKKDKEVHTKIGGSIDLVKVETSGEVPWSFGNHEIRFRLGFEGQVGVSAEAKFAGGWTSNQGLSIRGKLKLGFGLGLGVNFNIGYK